MSEKADFRAFARRGGKQTDHSRGVPAGQGKTTLARQYLDHLKTTFAWFRAGPEDDDPMLFFAAFLACLKSGLPEFDAPLVEETISSGMLRFTELKQAANILLHRLAEYMTGVICLRFDDLHLIDEHAMSLALMDHLLNKAGVMGNGVFKPTTVGTPQGGVISSLLANIALNFLDWHLAQHGMRFVRYADDFVVVQVSTPGGRGAGFWSSVFSTNNWSSI